MEAVNDMLKIAGHVYVIARTSFTSDPVLYERAKSATNVTPFTEHQVLEIKGMNSVEGISIKSLATGEVRDLSVEGVFIEIGLIPNSDAAKGIAELNSLGEIKVNTHCETGIPGLYAAGDVTNAPEKQIVVAAGEGAKAALQAHRYLQRLG
jgi:alkyl hydroperoxide reductase subunit F